ncbi:sigma factor-binding protein Crl [Moritella sp. 5]|uniref:sigma factor-binding protein Crl n=1 Tax=Moritella sp. 5 TaxID=2746231 RepID=UPI001BA80AFB|nr:sigma factor-binding protein Crl [Moritella sp. 5]QUM82254.1 sigma factor-binding protein Crl [Moritella sp. 5]
MPILNDPDLIYFRKRIRILNALGPYLREHNCQPTSFYFDCFSICIDAEIEPECREFYGWWLEMELVSDTFEYHYQFGIYNKLGEWVAAPIPDPYQHDVTQSLNQFYEKLSVCLTDQLTLNLKPSLILAKTLILSAA